MINPFTGKDGPLSRRKTGTAICFAVFATARIGYLMKKLLDYVFKRIAKRKKK